MTIVQNENKFLNNKYNRQVVLKTEFLILDVSNKLHRFGVPFLFIIHNNNNHNALEIEMVHFLKELNYGKYVMHHIKFFSIFLEKDPVRQKGVRPFPSFDRQFSFRLFFHDICITKAYIFR